MFRCIYSLQEFETSDGEHILHNFLGARWTSEDIVCNDLQRHFGVTIDSALEEGLRPIRNMLGTLGGRRDPGPTLKNLPTSTGEVLDLQPGGKPRLREPAISEQPLEDSRIRIQARLGKQSHLDWVFARIRESYPNAHIDEGAASASTQVVKGFVEGSVVLPVDLGGDAYFRGMLKACFNLLSMHDRALAFKPCFDEVRTFIRDGTGASARFIRWTESPDTLALPHLGPADQAIFIVSRDKSIEGVVQFFGEIVHCFQLTDAYDGPPFQCGYIVDPFREAEPAEDRTPTFDRENVPEFSKQALTNNPAVMAAFQKRFERIVALYFERSQNAMIQNTVQEVLRENGGNVLTAQMVDKIATRLAQQALRIPRSLDDTPSSNNK